MDRNIILAGVGGQGILTIAYVLDHSAGDLGLRFKQAEVHGMAQRGGAVQSHLRISDRPIASDLVPIGQAHLVLAVEPVEALRYVHYLRGEGEVVSSSVPFVNIPDYPELPDVFRRLEELPATVLVDSRKLARRAGSTRAQNVVMIGAAAPALGFPTEVLERYITQLFRRKGDAVVESNIRAFRLGLAAGRAFRTARGMGYSVRQARQLLAGVQPEALDEATLKAWQPRLAGARGAVLGDLLSGLTKALEHSGELLSRIDASSDDPSALEAALNG